MESLNKVHKNCKECAYFITLLIQNLKQLHNLYSSPNIVRMIKSKRMAWAGDRRGAYRVSAGNLRDGDHLEHVYVDGRILT